MKNESYTTWSNRPAFLLATVGGAVGLGNLWRFPYIAGENGGGGFVLIYLAFVFLLGLPILSSELLIGRKSHKSPLNSMRELVNSHNANSLWKSIGWMSVLLPFLGFSYYVVVCAWAIDYLYLAIINSFETINGNTSAQLFSERTSHSSLQIFLSGIFISMTVWVISKGVNNGIAKMSKILMPMLFVLIIILVIYGMIQGEFLQAVEFLFKPDFSKINGQSVVMALGQALFSLAIGTGLIMTYGSYMPDHYSIKESAAIVCIGDTLVALLAGLAIFPIVFANDLNPGEGPSLIFITLPIAFGSMPGGHLIGILFFILLIFAAFTSTMGMLEPIVAWLEEKYPGKRRILSIIAGFAIWLFALGSILSFSTMADIKPLAFLNIDRNFFGIIDFTVANLLLPINALLIAAFSGWVIKDSVLKEQFSKDTSNWRIYWRFTNRFIAPIAIGIVLIDLTLA
ncbi:MAG: NSS family neurotransmitter:Na+ symporter [Woeseiaceae bacterium]|jgi:NSS family neurotransmitter:Na+ symporter|tara:strand:- start:1243 stop:2607 length:1365 start_codon:yes stop_codon:yes gene_type:complete